ncbi:MAG TPA: FtsX-like permease family protein, partial [Candidatus Acidoferrum sp.]|nr:FtsX-like permease family protein [Candidatus Acidoferrum sp.]
QNISLMLSSPAYLPFYRIKLLAGRYPGTEGHNDVVKAVPRDGNPQPNGGLVINETAARQLGWTPAEALGKNLKMPRPDGMIYSPVVGVVADTIISTRDTPVAMAYPQMEELAVGLFPGVVSVRLSPEAGTNTLAQIHQVLANLFPGEIVQPYSLEDNIKAQYAQDHLQMQVFAGAALLAVAIACFGLFGLATFNTERRTKEIGVRKVMGGSVWSIVLLLTNDFSKLVLVANLIAWPLSYYAMNRWLQNFVYRIDLTPLLFIGSGLIALCIAWVTVGGTAAKAASQKPVLALRYE